ncbi:MAG TPA: MarR family transcriptional regulator [Gemmatimonadaceae bacterium]
MPSYYKGKPDEILALDTLIKLSRSLNAIQGSLLPSLQKDYGITEGQLGVLEALYHLGPLSQGQLCKKILRSDSNMTTVVDNLERDRLVKRTQSEDDRRVHIVSITERGRALMIQLLPEHVSRITGIMSALTKDEQRELGRLCRKLGTTVAR